MRHSKPDYFQLNSSRIHIFADSAELSSIQELAEKPWIRGFTTNPSLMHKAHVSTYAEFSKKVLDCVKGKPVSFEVFSDEQDGMIEQALILREWGENVVVKIPITNTTGVFSGPVIRALQIQHVPLNITAVFTVEQVTQLLKYLDPKQDIIISVFAGRIADTGRDPTETLSMIHDLLAKKIPRARLLWASCREVFNLLQAEALGCHIITVTPDVLKKLSLLGKNLDEYSLETVRAFYEDARAAGISLPVSSEKIPLNKNFKGAYNP